MFGTKGNNQKTDTTLVETPKKDLPPSIFDKNKQKEKDMQTKTVISKGCVFNGEISGENDINVFGKIQGSVSINSNVFTVEESAQVNASISAKLVVIKGKVVGNIEAIDKIIVKDSGNVTGDLVAPKVALTDGSYFKGNISMVDGKIKTSPVNKKHDTPTKPQDSAKNTIKYT
ncbi:hypothetical protein [uncultured Gammaproteobacteria bacterium]|nr:hypothetical protein [uncultured Gammaproteobacteria bacterium]